MVAWPSIARRFFIGHGSRNVRTSAATRRASRSAVLHHFPHPLNPGPEIRHGSNVSHSTLLRRRPCSFSSISEVDQPQVPPKQKDDDLLQQNDHRQGEAQEGNEETEEGGRGFISIDRTGLSTAPEHSHEQVPEETAMMKHLKSLIKFRGGPISVADYMEEVLTNPNAGFYMNRDVFGAGGDFITSPDVSQMFGELVGIWSMCLWQQMGQPEKVNLIELGPGRGTLMADFLRGVSKFSDFSGSISVHLVECSPALRAVQQKKLDIVSEQKEANSSLSMNGSCSQTPQKMSSTTFNCSFSWYADLEQVPRGVPSIIIAHEFFDALPIHQFQKSSRGWCEKLIDVDETSKHGLRFVLSPAPTTASKLYLTKRFKWASLQEQSELNQVEVCPQAMTMAHEIAKRVGEDGGGALIIDYGEDKMISDSLQGIIKHKFVDVLQDPGNADLSAHVDFAAIKHAIKEISVGAEAFGPITQSQFLGMLGINFRLEALLKNASDEQAESLQSGYWRLVGDGSAPWWEGEEELVPIGMGSRYKVLAIANSSLGPPQCFQ